MEAGDDDDLDNGCIIIASNRCNRTIPKGKHTVILTNVTPFRDFDIVTAV